MLIACFFFEKASKDELSEPGYIDTIVSADIPPENNPKL